MNYDMENKEKALVIRYASFGILIAIACLIVSQVLWLFGLGEVIPRFFNPLLQWRYFAVLPLAIGGLIGWVIAWRRIRRMQRSAPKASS